MFKDSSLSVANFPRFSANKIVGRDSTQTIAAMSTDATSRNVFFIVLLRRWGKRRGELQSVPP